MHSRHQSYEATLLSRTRFDLADALDCDALAEIAEAHGLTLQLVEPVDGIFLLVDCSPVQVLIAFCDIAMPVRHFQCAARPAAATLSEAEVLRRLHAHDSTATILVGDAPEADIPPDPRHDTLKRRLCWALTEWLFARSAPDLVFWCDSDMLYAAEEFDRGLGVAVAPAGIAPPAPVQALPRVPAHFRVAPDLPAEALAWVAAMPGDTQTVDPAPPPGGSLPRRVLRQTTMTCTAATLTLSGFTGLGPLIF